MSERADAAVRADFYQSHLDRVSRSFAFCIRQLPPPLREWVGLSYLLCRIVDTVEDAHWRRDETQYSAFSDFDRALMDPAACERLRQWPALFACEALIHEVATGERKLIADAADLLLDYHALPPYVHDILRDLIYSMSQGMQHFCRGRSEGRLRLKSLAEVNQYCFFVAGLVGELLAKLCARVEPRFQISQGVLLRAHHFGLFLQKVNLLKDQVEDEREGRHLIPSRHLVEESSQENALSAFEFLLALPKEQIEFRRFCAWSLFLGLEALSVARRSLGENRVLKVSRHRTQELLAAVESCLGDDRGLRLLFQSLLDHLGWGRPAAPISSSVSAAVAGSGSETEERRSTHSVPEWMLGLYHGPLENVSLAQLGL